MDLRMDVRSRRAGAGTILVAAIITVVMALPGPSPAPAPPFEPPLEFVEVHRTTFAQGADPTAGRAPVAPRCTADGPAVQMVHAVPAGQAPTPDAAARLVEAAAWINGDVIASAQADDGMREVRFAMDASCRPSVVQVTYSSEPGALNVVAAIRDALQAQGHSRADRIYLAWADGQASADSDGLICGVANRRRDDRPAPDGQAATSPLYGMLLDVCADPTTTPGMLHELFHMLGAAQESAPNFAGGGHVSDGRDLMSVDGSDGACPDPQAAFLADCGNDDYFAIAPAAGSYLATHWNSADSVFLIGGGTTEPPTEEPSQEPTEEPSQDPSEEPSEDPGGQQVIRFSQPEVAFRAAAVAQARVPDGGATPARVLLARDDEVADSLAASVLMGDAVLLYTATSALPDATAQELRRLVQVNRTLGLTNLPVTILGGPGAVSTAVEQEVRNLDPAVSVRRLQGPSRVETAIAIADASGVDPGTVAVARAAGTAQNPTAGWADAIAAGAYLADERVPLLLTPTDQLHPAVRSWLGANGVATSVVLGGEAAITATVAGQLPGQVVRLAGAGRDGTAAAVNRAWAGRGTDAAVAFNGYQADGWQDGLLAAGLAADRQATVLLVDAQAVPPATTDLLGGACPTLLVVGRAAAVSTTVIEELRC